VLKSISNVFFYKNRVNIKNSAFSENSKTKTRLVLAQDGFNCKIISYSSNAFLALLSSNNSIGLSNALIATKNQQIPYHQ
jgi:hypothetical protein